ncbi:transcriptional regulator [Xylocopilactobacillus apicola]|uniref:Transcriptional regulator n=2 Tax=Xylocopilactobacillus apicola TaxID=2932184 RepID=A0AAU9DA82_9LACO|nr:transcriptional regulator [Xylocopilactobacillus apicola]
MILAQEPEYGYGLSTKLNHYGLSEIPKGTIYPLLATMEKNGLIEGRMKPSDEGPDRKYFFITSAGQAAKADFIEQWNQLAASVTKLINEESTDEN